MSTIFQGISKKQKNKLLYTLEAHTFTYKKNMRILTSINNDNIIGIVLEGKIEIIKNDYNGDTILIETIEANNIFGSNISSINSYENDIITKEDSKIIIIDYPRIISTDYNTPYYNQFLKNLLEIITEKIGEKNMRLEIISKKTIRDKLLEYFKITSAKIGSHILYLSMSYTALANYLAIDRTAMAREMKNLIDEGFIKKENRKITLLYR